MSDPAHASTRSSPKIVYAAPFFADPERLLFGLQRGQRGARAAFYTQHADRVDELLRWIVGPELAGREIRTRVFVRAFRTFRSRHTSSADEVTLWLERLAVKEAERALRWRRLRRLWAGWAHRARSGSSEHDRSSPLPRAARGPRSIASLADGLTQAEALRRAYAVLHSMPRRHATALSLYWAGGYEIARVAELCNRPHSHTARLVEDGQRMFLERARRTHGAR